MLWRIGGRVCFDAVSCMRTPLYVPGNYFENKYVTGAYIKFFATVEAILEY